MGFPPISHLFSIGFPIQTIHFWGTSILGTPPYGILLNGPFFRNPRKQRARHGLAAYGFSLEEADPILMHPVYSYKKGGSINGDVQKMVGFC